MGKYKIKLNKKWTRHQVRKAIPLFASFFLAQFPLPAGNIKENPKMAVITPTSEALKFVNFELKVLSLYEDAGLQEAGLSLEVFNKAMVGYLNLYNKGALSNKKLLTIADFDKSSAEKRLWVIDLSARKLVHNSLVAHGKNSGLEKAENFSNVSKSEMSSLGFYVTHGTYQGKHGLSLKIEGMDAGYNTNAADRHVVVHGADYVSEEFVKQNGRLGRSQGCPALPMETHAEIIDLIKNETCLYLNASDLDYRSDYLDAELAMNTFYEKQDII